MAILGCGARSVSHINAVNHYNDKIEIVALCDLFPEKLEAKKKLIKTGSPETYTDYQKMLKRDDIHAVINVAWNKFHKEGSVACFDAGKHVLCEKPLSLTVTECKDIIAAAEKNKKVLQVGTQMRHNPGYAELAAQIHNGLIGNILYAWVHFFRSDWLKLFKDPGEDSRKNWRMKQSESGGINFEQGIHFYDLFNWFINSTPAIITSIGGNNNPKLQKRDSWDHSGLIVHYNNNALLTSGANLYSCGGPGQNCLFGDKATITIQPAGSGAKVTRYQRTYRRPFGMKEDPRRGSKELTLPSASFDTTTLQLGHFYDAVQGKKKPFPSGHDHLPAVQIARGSQIAAIEQRHIKASEVD